MEKNKWTTSAKKRFLADCDAMASKAVSTRWGVAVSTVGVYHGRFKAELGEQLKITDGKVRETRTKLEMFDPAAMKRLREARGLTMLEVSERARVPVDLIGKFEDVKHWYTPYTDRRDGNPSVAERLATVLRCETSDLQRKPEPVIPEPTEFQRTEYKIDEVFAQNVRIEEKLDKLLAELGVVL